jgi:hypothetical protein
MKPFHALTNRGQAGRLRRLALAALQQYDLPVRRVRLITNDLNGIFRLDTAGGERYMLRVSLPGATGHSLAEIRSEMIWLEALHRDTDLVNFILQDPNPDYRERVPQFVERAEGRLRAWMEAG